MSQSNVTANQNTTTGAKFKTDYDSGNDDSAPISKLMFGPYGTFTLVDATHGLPVEIVTPATLPISAATLPLPSGASTAANQTTGNATLALIESDTSNLVGIASNISVIVSGLVSIQSDLVAIGGYIDGLEALIGTTNTTLSTINGKITACNTGAVVLAAGVAEIGNVKNSGTFAVQVSSALPAGTNVIGHVILDASSAVIGHVVVDSGTVAATQSGTWTVGISAAQTIAVTNVGTFAVQAAQSGTWTVDTELPAVATLADATANPTTTSVGVLPLMYNGTTWDRVRGDTTNGIKVNATKLTPDGTNTMPSLDVAARAGFVKVTDGTNTQPAMDAVGRAGFVKVTDGTNTMPTMDSTARPGFVNLNLAGTAVSANSGVKDGGTVRVVIATDQPALTNTQPVKDLAQTSGGLSMHCSGPLANSNNATNVKASAGQVYAIQVFNVTATVAYLKLYNKASSPSPASDTPVKVIPIPANTSVGGVSVKWEKGLEFTTGIAYAVVTGISSTDNTSVAANSGIVNIDYK